AALHLRFTPTALGSRSAALMLATNATNRLDPVGLTGTGVLPQVPTLSISPAELAFGPEPMGTSSLSQAIVCENTGNAPLDIRAVRIDGAAAGAFAITGD